MQLAWSLALLPLLGGGGASHQPAAAHVRLHVHPSGDDASAGSQWEGYGSSMINNHKVPCRGCPPPPPPPPPASLSTLRQKSHDNGHASQPLALPQSCAVVDISTGASTLHEAQQQARKVAAPCAIVKLGRRSFQLTEPLVLTSADSSTHWIGQGAEITTGYDVPPDAWTRGAAEGGAATASRVQMNASLLVNRSHFGSFTLSNGLEDGHLALLIKIRGVWRPMTVARWPVQPKPFLSRLLWPVSTFALF